MKKEEAFKKTFFRKGLFFGSCLALISFLILLVPAVSRADTPSNAEIIAGVQSRLYHAGIYKHGKVSVKVKNGVATLKGTVASYADEVHAVRTASHQKGVIGVVDNINVSTEGVGPHQILKKARYDVLTYPYYTIFDHITLSARGNRLTVGGQVTEPYKKYDLGNILADIKGVTHVKNNIQVLPTSFFDDHIREEIAERIYGDPVFANYAIEVNPSIHIIVDNGNVTLYGVVNNPVDRKEAAIDARFAATYFGLKNDLRVSS